MIQQKSTLTTVHEIFSLPEQSPDMEFILRTTAFPHIDQTSVLDKKIVVLGHVDLCIEYIALTIPCAQAVYFVSFTLPFNCVVIESCRIKAAMNVQLKAIIEFQKVDLIECRCIEALTLVNISVLKMTPSCRKLPPHEVHPQIVHCCYPSKKRENKVCPPQASHDVPEKPSICLPCAQPSTTCNDPLDTSCGHLSHNDTSATYYHDWISKGDPSDTCTK